MDEEGKIIHNDYMIYKKIGRGASADVYYSKQISTNNIFAIKMVNKSNINKKLIKYLESEIELLKTTKHENIIKLHDHFIINNTLVCIVLEYCNCGDLSNFIKKRNSSGWTLDENLSRHFFKQLINGLYYCHTLNIIHRDIKPPNLLLCGVGASSVSGANGVSASGFSSAGKNYVDLILKITDFGFAKILKEEMMDTICGSPLYMAPEVMKNETKYNYKSDIWSCGVIFWELLFGLIPNTFAKAKNIIQLLNIIETEKLQIPIINSKFPSKTSVDLVFKMMQKNPNKRIDYEGIINHSFFKEKALVPLPSSPINLKSAGNANNSYSSSPIVTFLNSKSLPAFESGIMNNANNRNSSNRNSFDNKFYKYFTNKNIISTSSAYLKKCYDMMDYEISIMSIKSCGMTNIENYKYTDYVVNAINMLLTLFKIESEIYPFCLSLMIRMANAYNYDEKYLKAIAQVYKKCCDKLSVLQETENEEIVETRFAESIIFEYARKILYNGCISEMSSDLATANILYYNAFYIFKLVEISILLKNNSLVLNAKPEFEFNFNFEFENVDLEVNYNFTSIDNVCSNLKIVNFFLIIVKTLISKLSKYENIIVLSK